MGSIDSGLMRPLAVLLTMLGVFGVLTMAAALIMPISAYGGSMNDIAGNFSPGQMGSQTFLELQSTFDDGSPVPSWVTGQHGANASLGQVHYGLSFSYIASGYISDHSPEVFISHTPSYVLKLFTITIPLGVGEFIILSDWGTIPLPWEYDFQTIPFGVIENNAKLHGNYYTSSVNFRLQAGGGTNGYYLDFIFEDGYAPHDALYFQHSNYTVYVSINAKDNAALAANAWTIVLQLCTLNMPDIGSSWLGLIMATPFYAIIVISVVIIVVGLIP